MDEGLARFWQALQDPILKDLLTDSVVFSTKTMTVIENPMGELQQRIWKMMIQMPNCGIARSYQTRLAEQFVELTGTDLRYLSTLPTDPEALLLMEKHQAMDNLVQAEEKQYDSLPWNNPEIYYRCLQLMTKTPPK